MSLPTYDEAFQRAKEGSPFSNGDEGYGWMANWCDRCVHDREARAFEGSGCPLVCVALNRRTPVEWLDQKTTGPDGLLIPYSIGDQYRCMYFRSEDDGPDPEPTPIPDPPGQLTLTPREPFEQARMLTPLISETPIEVTAP